MLPDAMLSTMRKRISEEVPGTKGFRTSTASSAYQNAAYALLDGGHHEDEIVKMLAGLYAATIRECGGRR